MYMYIYMCACRKAHFGFACWLVDWFSLRRQQCRQRHVVYGIVFVIGNVSAAICFEATRVICWILCRLFAHTNKFE